ncbi:MAG: hypothetical protein JWP81_629 [Ferruginibacter sp.]|nr:hypothetical protein [Ferruginibacter sp.]
MQWKQDMRHSISGEVQPVIESTQRKESIPRTFQYTGNTNLIVKGISSGIVYHFHYNGEKIEVDYYDSFALMAERDLKTVS